MKKSLLIISAAVVFSAGNVLGETHYVLPGDKIQPVIDDAKDGDTVVVIGGEYPYDVTIDGKDIKFKKPFGDEVTINGDVFLKNLDNHFELKGFTILGDTTSNTESLDIENCSDVIISNVISKRVDIEGSNVYIIDSEMVKLGIYQTKSEAKVIRSKIEDTLHIDGGSSNGHVFFQNEINSITSGSKSNQKIIFSYNKITKAHLGIRGKVIAVGNIFDGSNNSIFAAFRWDMSNAECYLEFSNNIIRHFKISGVNLGGIGIYCNEAEGATIKIYNNIIHDILSENTAYNSAVNDKSGHATAILINTLPVSAEILGNVIGDIKSNDSWGFRKAKGIYAPFDNVLVKGNYFFGTGYTPLYGGVRDLSKVEGDPSVDFIDFENGNYKLTDNSKCIDAGPTDPWHFDRDGSRNDIGLYGGSMFDPNGMTTENPVILFSNHEPLQLIKGKDKTINISAGGIVVP